MAEQRDVKPKLEVDVTIEYKELTDIDRDEPLGSGSYGIVFKACYGSWGCYVAYKELRVNPVLTGSAKQMEHNK